MKRKSFLLTVVFFTASMVGALSPNQEFGPWTEHFTQGIFEPVKALVQGAAAQGFPSKNRGYFLQHEFQPGLFYDELDGAWDVTQQGKTWRVYGIVCRYFFARKSIYGEANPVGMTNKDLKMVFRSRDQLIWVSKSWSDGALKEEVISQVDLTTGNLVYTRRNGETNEVKTQTLQIPKGKNFAVPVESFEARFFTDFGKAGVITCLKESDFTLVEFQYTWDEKTRQATLEDQENQVFGSGVFSFDETGLGTKYEYATSGMVLLGEKMEDTLSMGDQRRKKVEPFDTVFRVPGGPGILEMGAQPPKTFTLAFEYHKPITTKEYISFMDPQFFKFQGPVMLWGYNTSLPKYRTPTEAMLKEALKADLTLPAEDPLLKKTAAEITQGVNGEAAKAKAILKWVYNNIDYDESVLVASCQQTLAQRRGDCSEFTALITSLCRAAGIPAQPVTGWVYFPDQKVFIGHAWVAVWAEGRWIELEGTSGEEILASDWYVPAPLKNEVNQLKEIRVVSLEKIAF